MSREYRVPSTKHCHPERSTAVSEANRLAESKDPYSVYAAQDY